MAVFGVTDVLDYVYHLQGKHERCCDLERLQKGSQSHCRERGDRALSRVVRVGKRKGSFQFIFKLVYRTIFGQILHADVSNYIFI
jgi:hypothetical protein